MKKANKSDNSRNLLMALPYLFFPIAVILLVVEETKKPKERDPVLRHHAYNALGFFISIFVLSIAIWAVSWIPLFGAVVVALYWIAAIILALLFAIKAYQGEKVIIPFVTDFMKRNVKGF